MRVAGRSPLIRAVGGTAFRPFFSQIAKRQITADYDEFDSLADLDAALVTSEEYEASRNCYGVKAGQSLEDWEKSGWIRAPDFRGWIQWCVGLLRTADPAGTADSTRVAAARTTIGRSDAGSASAALAVASSAAWSRRSRARAVISMTPRSRRCSARRSTCDHGAVRTLIEQHWAYRLTAADYAANLA